jgi:KDO2-lipid IV(A) lauroyltransferase
MLTKILYYAFIIPVSSLPFPVLYKLSDVIFLILFYVIGYRKKVVTQNIKNSFPELDSTEQSRICKKYYRHLSDLVVESLKVFTISEREIQKRMIIKNPEFILSYFEQKRSLILAGGHNNNWELFAVAIDAAIQHQAIGIYQPLTDTFFNDKMCKSRSKFGLKMISTKTVKEVFDRERNNVTVTIFGVDQSPALKSNCHVMEFLNQETRVAFGAEKYAKEYNYPVVYGKITKLKRGYYSFEFSDTIESPVATEHGEITERITRLIEQDIRRHPEFWLWSHKRWKKRKLPSA